MPHDCAILRGPPDPSTYRYVAYRDDKATDLAIGVHLYDAPTESRAVLWNGREVHMVFLREHIHLEIVTKRGWTDITDEWMACRDAAASVTSYGQLARRIVDAAWAGWEGQGDPRWWKVEAAMTWCQDGDAKADPSSVRAALSGLVDAGLLEREGAGFAMRYRLTEDGRRATFHLPRRPGPRTAAEASHAWA